MLKVMYKSSDSSSLVNLPGDMKITKNFTLQELANNEGNPAQAQYIISPHSICFNELVQDFRDAYARPIDPTSGYRQPAYNKKVGGDSNSLHLQACAMDFIDKYKKDDDWMLSTWLRILMQNSVIGAVNIYNNNGLYRYHIEAFSDVYLKYTKNRIRVYTDKAHYTAIANQYEPLGIEVKYHGSN